MAAANSDIHDRSLMHIKDWHLVKSEFATSPNTLAVYAVHTSCNPNSSRLAGVRVLINQCWRCGDAVPDEMQALVTLYHWGREDV